MALISCPECKKQISNAAPNCVHCGYPINISEGEKKIHIPEETSNSTLESEEKIHTVQETGKGLKLQRVLSFLLVLVGLILWSQPGGLGTFGFIVCLFGVLWFLYAGILIWWHHK